MRQRRLRKYIKALEDIKGRKMSPVTSKCTTRGRIKMYHLGTLVF